MTKERFASLGPPRSAGPPLVLAAVCLLVVGGGMPAWSGSQPNLAPWKTVAASGPVEAHHAQDGEAWQAVSRGDELQPQTLVRTGKKGRTTLARNASVMIVDPRSEVELPDNDSGEMETSVVQTRGSVVYEVDSRANPHFEVVTPYLVAGVKGTKFIVTVSKRFASVTVEHGMVEVTNPMTGEQTHLGPGESVIQQRDAGEMEVQNDLRRSRLARKNMRRMSGTDTTTDKTRDVASRPNWDQPNSTDKTRMDVSLVSDSEKVDDDRGIDDVMGLLPDLQMNVGHETGGDDSTKPMHGSDDVTKELIEEMIREGVNDGWLVEPPDKSDPINLPNPGGPGEPTLPPGNPTIPGGNDPGDGGLQDLQKNP